MGSDVIINQTKPRFDLTMSRRTRKPLSTLINDMHHQDISQPKEEEKQEQDQEQNQEQKQEKEEIDRKSLNNLMKCEKELSGEVIDVVENKMISCVGQSFVEDEGIKHSMQLVTKVKKDKQNGVKFKGMMGRYVKVLSGLIKAKRDRKTPVLRFNN